MKYKIIVMLVVLLALLSITTSTVDLKQNACSYGGDCLYKNLNVSNITKATRIEIGAHSIYLNTSGSLIINMTGCMGFGC